MNLRQILEKNNFSPEIISAMTSSGIEDLYPPQASAVEKGILQGKNLVMSVPTAAGKTLIAELCLLRAIHHQNGRCIYIAPLKALASEKYNDFKKKYGPLGIEVGLAIGDLDSPSKYLNKYQIIVATAEKVDSLLRSQARWLIDNLATVVLDEIHFINDGTRGPTMEILTARIKQLNPNVQILALSATVSNAAEMAKWLNAELVLSDWRPIPLKEGVFFNDCITFDKHGTRMIYEEVADDMSKLSLDTLRGRGQVLIFVNSRRSTQAVAREICKDVALLLKPEEKKDLLEISKKIIGSASDATKICQKLGDTIRCGVAFHHAGLKSHQRELIEENFKKNLIKVICCTPTLAAGVNLPARRAVIRDCKRFESGLGAAYIPTSEYKQCAGRAGRPQYDEFGEAVLVAKTHSESQTLFERYIYAKPEPVISKLGSESALRMHVLSSIAGGYVHDVKGMFEFISHTFLFHQKQHTNLLDLIGEIFDFLYKEGFVDKSGYRFFATAFGALTSRLYIDPQSAIVIRNGLQKIKDGKTFPSIGILHLLCCCPDSTLLNIGKKEIEEIETFASHFRDEWIMTPESYAGFDDFYTYLATLKTAWLFNQWLDEEKEDSICDQFGIGPGDIYRHVESIGWLLYATGRMAELFQKKMLTFHLEGLRKRVQYGIREELLEIVQLKGIGRIRGRILFEKGLGNFTSLKKISSEELAKIPSIGKSLAEDILKQVFEAKLKTPFTSTSQSLKDSEPNWDD